VKLKLSFLDMSLTLFLISIFSVSALAKTNPVPPNGGQLHLGATQGYFNSTENFSTSGGGFSSLPKDGKYEVFNTTFLVDYDFSRSWRVTSDFNAINVSASNSSYSHSNFHLGELGLGGEAWADLGPLPFVFHTRLGVPLFEPDLLDSSSFGSDGAMNAELGVLMRPKFSRIQGKFGLSALWRGNNLSTLLPWTAGAALSLPVGQIGGGVRGFQTLISDSESTAERTKRSNAITNGQAGSFAELTTDPELMQFYLESRWGLVRNLDFSTDMSYDFNGKTYAKGYYIGIGLHWLIDFGSASLTQDSSGKSFEVKKKNYEKSLFEKANPTRRPEPKPVRKRQKSIKQLLDETEDSLEP